MRRLNVVVLQHHAAEHPGSLRGILDRGGHRWHAIDLGGGGVLPSDPCGWDALVVMGGTMHVWEVERHPWLADEIGFIRDWVTAGRPYFGICLGHQLLATAMGGEVALMSRPEVGMGYVELTNAGQRDRVTWRLLRLHPALHWHHAEVTRLPDGAVVLARNKASEVQAMRVGHKAWGVQFHPEVDGPTLADWRATPDYAEELERTLGSDGRARFDAAADARAPELRAYAQRLFGAFLGQAAAAPRPRPPATA